MTHHNSEPVLIQSARPTFRITQCTVFITIAGDLQTADYTFEYDVIKESEGEDIWQHTSPFPREQFHLRYVRDGSEQSLRTEWKARLDRKASFLIHLNPASGPAPIGQGFHFVEGYTSPVESTVVRELRPLVRRVVLWIPRSFASPCDHIETCVTFENTKYVRVLSSGPAPESKDGKLKFSKGPLAQGEYFNVFVLVEAGVVPMPIADILNKLFWILVGSVVTLGVKRL